VLIPSGAAAISHIVEAFRQGLQDHGYVEGRNIVLDRRYGEASMQRISDVAAELVRIKVDVIVAATDQAVAAVKQQTQTIPIVMVNSTDPVGTQLVASLARPGGNVTGLTTISPEINGKRLELLREVLHGLSRVAMIWNPDVRGDVLDYRGTERAARSLGLRLQSVEVRRTDDFSRAFAAAGTGRAEAVIVPAPNNTVTFSSRVQMVGFARENRLPVMYGYREFADVGGLMAYGPNLAEAWRHAVIYVARSSRGSSQLNCRSSDPPSSSSSST
jgi:putative ABC transport system substrate-binding protein